MLKQIRPEEEQDAHLRVILWTWIRNGVEPSREHQILTSALNRLPKFASAELEMSLPGKPQNPIYQIHHSIFAYRRQENFVESGLKRSQSCGVIPEVWKSLEYRIRSICQIFGVRDAERPNGPVNRERIRSQPRLPSCALRIKFFVDDRNQIRAWLVEYRYGVPRRPQQPFRHAHQSRRDTDRGWFRA